MMSSCTVNPNPFKDVLTVTVQSPTRDQGNICVDPPQRTGKNLRGDELLSCSGTNTVQIKETGK